MFFSVETVRCLKVRVDKSECRRLFVHHGDEGGDRTCHLAGECFRGIVGTAEHQPVEQLAHGEDFAGF